jgi:peptidoglycan L-alanyl-D-glutamate endopeptidase CwlK
MFAFSRKSKTTLYTCDLKLQTVAFEVIKVLDITVFCGFRGQEEQDELHAKGLSRQTYPFSKHNQNPSKAMDICPSPWDFGDPELERLYFLGGLVKGIAFANGIGIRWGGDWDGDYDFNDQTFNDLYHFELLDS